MSESTVYDTFVSQYDIFVCICCACACAHYIHYIGQTQVFLYLCACVFVFYRYLCICCACACIHMLWGRIHQRGQAQEAASGMRESFTRPLDTSQIQIQIQIEMKRQIQIQYVYGRTCKVYQFEGGLYLVRRPTLFLQIF